MPLFPLSLFSRSHALALAAGLALLAGAVPAVHAQGGVKPVAPTAKIDPQAKAVLDQMTAAYTALQTYSATLAVETTGTGAPQKQTVTLSFQRPKLARIAIAEATGPVMEVVSDGARLSVSATRDKQYTQEDAPAGDAVTAVLSQARGTLLPTLVGNPKVLSRLFSTPGVAVSLGTPQTIGDAPTDTIVIVLSGPAAGKNQITLSVGTGDHLLRQLRQSLKFTRNGQTSAFSHTETVTAQTLNASLTAADFAFVPPPGVKKVASLEPPLFDPRIKPGASPFPITAKDLNGRPLSLAQYKGKVVLMDFWATWCGPCVGEMPNVIAAYKKYHAQGFDVVGISLDQDRGALTSFLKQNKMPWRQVYDGKGWGSAVPRRYGVMAIPFGLLLNRDGTIAAVEVRGEALPTAIKMALAKR